MSAGDDLLAGLREHVAVGASAEVIAVTVAEWLRKQGNGWESRGHYEITMRRERAGMRLRTAAVALYGLADDLRDVTLASAGQPPP